MKKIILSAAAILACGSLFAQKDSLNAVIQVENDYNPVVVKATKQSFTPQVEMTANNTPLNLVFSQEATPFEKFVSERNVKEVLPKQEGEYPGYVRMGYGNNNNLDARLAYRLTMGKRDKFNLLAGINGFSTELDGYAGDWDSRFYNTLLTADYEHSFDNLTLGVTATIGNKVFNYQSLENAGGTDKQHGNSYSLLFDVASNSAGRLSYSAAAGYELGTRKYSSFGKKGISENRLIANGTLAYELPNADIRRMGLSLELDGFIYNNAMSNSKQENRYDDYMSIKFNPFMDFRFDNWKVRIGVHADMLTANGTFFAFAPDCSIEGAVSKNVTLFATATGGRTLNTFARMDELSPYWNYMAGSEQYTASYKIFDITAGGRVSFEPFSINLYTGYAYTKDDLLPAAAEADNIVYTLFGQHNSRNFYVGGRFGYDYGGWFKFATDLRYDHWSCGGSDDFLAYKPQITAEVNAEARLYDGLFANIVYTLERYTKGEEERIENTNNLQAKISYRFHERMGAFVQGNNLLGSDHFAYAGYLAQGANVLAGVTITF